MKSELLFCFVCGLVLGSAIISLWQLGYAPATSISASGQKFLRESPLKKFINSAIRRSSNSSSSASSSRSSSSSSNSSSRRARILCLIVTHPGNYKLKAEPVHNTWARRCDKHVFVGSHSSSHTEPGIPLMKLSVKESRESLWQKTWMAFTQAADEFGIDNFDFFLKADDDTFVVVENLRLLLRRFDPRQPSLLGRRFALGGDRRRSYMSGGGGYVLSREAVRLFVAQGVRAKKCSLSDRGAEDYNMGSCLSSLGVQHLDSRDEQKLETFHPLTMDDMTGFGGIPDWMHTYCYYKLKVCRTCISKRSVTFHYVHNMYHMEILLYHLRPASV